MLAIRLQRTGRSGHAQYRMIVQDARKSPTSGKIVTSLGSYNPHTKSLVINKEKAGLFLSNGAQPSSRVVSLLAKDGVKIPDWAQKLAKKERATRNIDKLRKNRPAEVEVAPVVADEPVVAVEAEATPADAPVDTDTAVAEVAAPEVVAEETALEVVESIESTEAVAEEVTPPEVAAEEVTEEPKKA